MPFGYDASKRHEDKMPRFGQPNRWKFPRESMSGENPDEYNCLSTLRETGVL